MWIKPTEAEGVAAGTAQIREVRNGRILGRFDWSGFGERADNTAFKVLWRSDSKYFAISYELSRGWMSGAIYGRNRAGHWAEIKLPSDAYVNGIKKMSGVAELSSGKGCETPKDWLSNGDLELEFCSENIFFADVDAMKEFEVTLGVADQKGEPLSAAKMILINQKSEEEVERELHSQ